jgi:hypothetical protein
MDVNTAATVEEIQAAAEPLGGPYEMPTWAELYEIFQRAARMPGSAAGNMARLIDEHTGCASETPEAA